MYLLDFEEPLAALQEELERLKKLSDGNKVPMTEELEVIKLKIKNTKREIYAHLSRGSVEKVEADLKQLFPKNDWFRRHIQMIAYGRKYCNRVACKAGRLCRVCGVLGRL